MEIRKSPLTQLSEVQYPEIVKQGENLDPQLFIKAQEHMARNRYPNVLPNEPTRFTIEKEPHFYFNANWVLEKRAIACQGPMSDEIDHFWKMVCHANVQTIVMLTNLVEGRKNKCSNYWKGYSFNEEKIFEKEIPNKKPQIIVRREIEVPYGNETRTVVQFHLQNWPDFGVVEPETLAKLVEVVACREGKLLAHCSAGVGRSGAFLSAFEAHRQKTKQIYAIVANLRNPLTGRVGMVQTAEQYRLALKTAELMLAVPKEIDSFDK
ncbi:MAG: hypothetical protein JSS30_02120 [Verrucomicrobia bacterium]|nr:hypothetical protein [Verrucomicrobiota bacterium]